MLSRQSDELVPRVSFDGHRGLTLIDRQCEHRLFNPSLEIMLRRYVQEPESRGDARRWLQETDTYSPFGFVALCEYLELDANWVRRGLLRWMDNVDSESRFRKAIDTDSSL